GRRLPHAHAPFRARRGRRARPRGRRAAAAARRVRHRGGSARARRHADAGGSRRSGARRCRRPRRGPRVGGGPVTVSRFPRRLNWRGTPVHFLANAVGLGVPNRPPPGVVLHAKHPGLGILWRAAVFGILTALVRPALEFLFLPYVLQSLGLVVIFIDAVLLALLALTRTLEIRGFGALVLGAVVAGVLGFLL